MSMIKELNGLLALMRHDQHGQYDNPNRVTSDYADRLEGIIRKYEEPTEVMVEAGAKAIAQAHLRYDINLRIARACFEAMIEAEEASHD